MRALWRDPQILTLFGRRDVLAAWLPTTPEWTIQTRSPSLIECAPWAGLKHGGNARPWTADMGVVALNEIDAFGHAQARA